MPVAAPRPTWTALLDTIIGTNLDSKKAEEPGSAAAEKQSSDQGKEGEGEPTRTSVELDSTPVTQSKSYDY